MNRRQDLGLVLFLIVILIVLLAHKAGLKRVRDHMPSLALVFIGVRRSFPGCPDQIAMSFSQSKCPKGGMREKIARD